MKKLSLICLIIFTCFFTIFNKAQAETLDEYIAKAQAALKAERATSAKKQMTEAEKNKALAEKEQISQDITTTENEIKNLEAEIEQLEESIDKKDKEIKEIMKFVQVSSGDSAYLEYAFGASNFTDFIYRISVSEQLSSYNDDLIKDYNNDIKSISQKQAELSQKQKELKTKQEELSKLITKLSSEIEDLSASSLSYKAEYESLMNYVNSLKNMGCKGYEDMLACQNRLNKDTPNIDTGGGSFSGFYMPLDKGRITQNYYNTNSRQHNAIDMTNYEGAPVYGVAAGKVISITRPSDGCGHIVAFIRHVVNGQVYTTVYYHLKTINVSVGQVIDYTTKIGTQGGNKAYDTCSTASHLDFKLFKGEYGKDFYSLTKGPHMNPRVWLTQAPAEGKSFYSR